MYFWTDLLDKPKLGKFTLDQFLCSSPIRSLGLKYYEGPIELLAKLFFHTNPS